MCIYLNYAFYSIWETFANYILELFSFSCSVSKACWLDAVSGSWGCGLLWVECLQSILCLAVTYCIFLSLKQKIKDSWMKIRGGYEALCDLYPSASAQLLLSGITLIFSGNLEQVFWHCCYLLSHFNSPFWVFFALIPLVRWPSSLLDCRCCSRPMREGRSSGGQWCSGAQGLGSSETHSYSVEWFSCSLA